MQAKQAIIEGKTSLGIELGSTRIKAVLIGEDFSPVASGGHDWENSYENGVWTYSLDDVWSGLQNCYKNLAGDVEAKFGIRLSTVGSVGISAMMHGYLVFDKGGRQLVPFRTWRNTSTEKAASKLSELFNFNIPQRWSVAHLYQAILGGEAHVPEIDFMTTLAGYVHWQLTGEKVLGLDDASGMFPIENGVFCPRMLEQFASLSAPYPWKLPALLPKTLKAGQPAGSLSAAGAKMLDPSGILQAGIPFCPPEGDAGTGMVATNSVSKRTGNISAGTSIFAMIVLEKELSQMHPEVDMVVTPDGSPVAMVHCNNCSGDIDAWVKLFGEAIETAGGGKVAKADLYDALYIKALEGDGDCGGLLSFNYYSGEHITGFDAGRPLFARLPDSRFNLANFMRCLLFSSMGSLKIGMDILTEKEDVRLDVLLGHGGLFKTKGVAQRFMAAALETPVSVMESASEGGAWGIALLAAYLQHAGDVPLDGFLSQKVFSGSAGLAIAPDAKDVAGFKEYMKRFEAGLEIQRAAVQGLKG
ncbi:MAG: FGGY-family carbohydrate kinase [Spirochaetes bacterium]|nr:FGGY-family carbohydrate kinase [Spirochaetota bacterium]